ncbi:MAG: hypothetical protein K2J77_09595 [Oscillospiraceae bacterium]|nr:hypothetical protein [Oscillospiraceae bacterium]
MDCINKEDQTSAEWRWCLVGNIVETHEFGEEHEIRYGNKQFRPGAKVFINLVYGGMGHENILVIGVPRHMKQYIEVVIRRKHVCNFRVQKVYKPAVLKLMSASEWDWWDNSDDTRASLEKSAEWMNAAAEDNLNM